MTNSEISEKFSSLVKTERKITLEILQLINLVEDRKLHLERGFGSLHDWLIKEHKYSESAANRRIQAARVLRSVALCRQHNQYMARRILGDARANQWRTRPIAMADASQELPQTPTVCNHPDWVQSL